MKKRILSLVYVLIIILFLSSVSGQVTCNENEDLIGGRCTTVIKDIENIVTDDINYPGKLVKISAIAGVLRDYFLSLEGYIGELTCNNGIKDGDETGIDCGGSCPSRDCCKNGYLDEGEEGLDCGGNCPISCKPEFTENSFTQTNGPFTDYNPRIFFDPDNLEIIYTSSNTGNGILKSVDGGESWQRLDEGIAIPYIFYFDIAPSNHNIMYASTATGQVFRSDNKGKDWADVTGNLKLDSMGIWSLAIHPLNPNIVYIGTGSYSHLGGIIFKTVNGGETWEEMDIGPNGRFISSIVIDSVDPNIVYATTAVIDACKVDSHEKLAGVYKTTNGGETWVEANNGLLHHGISRLVIDPTDHNTLFVGTGCVGLPDLPDGSIFKSTDGGENWAQIHDSPVHSIGPIVFDSNNPNIMYAQGYYSFEKSEDHGETWDSIYEGYQGAAYHFPYEFIVDPRNSDIMYMGTYSGGVLKSINGGKNWFESNGNRHKGFIIGHANAVSVFPSNPSVMYAATIGGPFKTLNGGETWEPLEEEQHTHSVNRAIKVDPVNPNVAYFTGLDGFIRVNGNELQSIYSEGQASEWVEPQLIDLLFDPNNHNILYTAFLCETELAPDYDGFYRFDVSDPSNPSREKRNVGLTNIRIHSLTLDENTRTIYAGTEHGARLRSGGQGKSEASVSGKAIGFFGDAPGLFGKAIGFTGGGSTPLFKTTNEGQSWEEVNSDLSFITIYKLLFPDNYPNKIYGATNGHGVIISLNNGQDWEIIDPASGLMYITLIALNQNEDILYAYDTSNQKVYKTVEIWSEEWQEWNKYWESIFDFSQISPTDQVKTLAVDGENIYLGTMENAIFKSEDSGDTWQQKQIKGNDDVRWIEIDPNNPNKVYAGVVGEEGTIYMSNNWGETWNKLNDDLTFSTIHEIAIDPNNENVVYAAPWGGGLFKSIDSGNSWNEIETPTISIPGIIVDPENSNHLIIADRIKPKIYQSFDAGQSWSDLVALDEEDYYRISTMGLYNGELYFSAFNKIRGMISLFVDGPMSGTTFKLGKGIPVEIPELSNNLIIDFFSNGENLFAVSHIKGIYMLNGEKWLDISKNLPDMGFNNIIADDEIFISGASDIDLNLNFRIGNSNIVNEIYKSSDNGITWSPLLRNNPFSSDVKKLLQHPTNSNVFFAATQTGLYVSADRGESWTAQNTGLNFKNIGSMAVTDNYVYVGTLGGGVYAGKINPDYSITWQETTGPYPTIHNIQIKVDPTDSNIIYATSFPGGVFKSTDGGETWIESNFALPSFNVANPDLQGYYSLEMNPTNTQELYLGIFGKGVYKSTDGAAVWMPMYKLENRNVYSVSVDSLGEHLYASTNGQPSLFRNPIGSNSWEKLTNIKNEQTVVSSIAVNPDNSDEIYVAAFPGGLFKTTDGGKTWYEKSNNLIFKKRFITGIGYENFFYNVVINPVSPNIIYLSGYLGELYKSEDAGQLWDDFSEGLIRRGIITDLDIDVNGQILVVSQKAGGVSKIRLR